MWNLSFPVLLLISFVLMLSLRFNYDCLFSFSPSRSCNPPGLHPCACASVLCVSSSIPPVQHYRDDDLLSIHSSTLGLHLSGGEDPQQQDQEMMMSAGAVSTSGSGDVVIVVNATDNEDDEDEATAVAAPSAVNDGCQLVVDIDTDPDYLADSPKRGYRTDSSGEHEDSFYHPLIDLYKLNTALSNHCR